MSSQRNRKISATQPPATMPAAGSSFRNSLLPPERNPALSASSGAIELRHLIKSKETVDSLDREDGASATRIMLLSCKWAKFLRGATFEDAEVSMPFFNRFVDSVLGFSSQADLFSVKICLSALENLIHREPAKISNALGMLLEAETRPEAREQIVHVLEKNFAFILDPRCFYALGELLKEYENGPDSYNPSVAITASSFLFAWKDNLMQEGREDMLAYAVAWAHNVPERERISLMHDILLCGKGNPAEIIARAADMSVLRSGVQDEAIGLLARMGVHNFSFSNPQGQKVEARTVNMLLEEKILEDAINALGERIIGKNVMVGNTPYYIANLRQHLH